MNQCWVTINKVHWHSFHGRVYLKTQDINLQIVCLKFTHLKSQPHFPGDNELNKWIHYYKPLMHWSSSQPFLIYMLTLKYSLTSVKSILLSFWKYVKIQKSKHQNKPRWWICYIRRFDCILYHDETTSHYLNQWWWLRFWMPYGVFRPWRVK